LGGGSGRTGGGSGGQSTVTQPIASPWDELKASAGGGGSGSEPPRGGGGGGEQPPSGGDDPDPEKILRYEDLPKGTRVPDTSKPLYYLQPKPKTMRDTTEGGLNNAKQTAKNIADNPKIGKGVKGVALGAGLTALGVAATQPFIGAEGRQFTRDIIPGEDSPEQQEAYYRQLAKQERELQEAKLRPYLLTPQEQAEMGRQQAYWAAQQRGRFQRVQGMQEVLASQMSNALQAHLQAMSQANNAVQTVMNSEFM
jgi:hypothetical protein